MSEGEVIVVTEIVSVSDREGLNEYQTKARDQFAKWGGSIFARGGHTVEGDPPFGVLMLMRWPSEAAFRGWQDSEEYKPLRAVREKAFTLRIAVLPAT